MDLTAEPVPPGQLGTTASDPAPVTRPARRRRPWPRAVVQVFRRVHLYAGLLMLPWVLLYGVTAFLFNHPTAFSDQPTGTFDRAALAGTPMERSPTPADLAGQVVAALQARAKPGTKYTLAAPGQAQFNREFAFATVKTDGPDLNVLVDVTGNGGTVRARPAATPKPEEPAPFAVGGRPAGPPAGRGGARGGERPGARAGEGLKLDHPLHERVRESIPAVLETTGFPTGEVTVTSVPDLVFSMDADGTLWRVTYNAQTGAVSGRRADEAAAGEPLSARRFLTRLHVAHGYPGEVNARWAWAVVVDVMAAVMVFWGLSGVLMWWQIKATRRAGAVVLLVSAVAAVWAGLGMHDMLTAAGAR